MLLQAQCFNLCEAGAAAEAALGSCECESPTGVDDLTGNWSTENMYLAIETVTFSEALRRVAWSVLLVVWP